MTKTTTGSSRGTVVLSWIIALICFAGGALLLWLMPVPEQGTVKLQEDKKQSPKNASQKIKQEQSQRALPANYAEQLVKQSEQVVKKNLEDQLRKFRQMSEKMRLRKNELLDKVEARKLPRSAPSDANDTSQARSIPQPGRSSTNASVKDLYDLLREYESDIQKNHLAASAAKRALSNGLSFPVVYLSMKEGTTRMPDCNELIRMQMRGGEWGRSQHDYAGGLDIKSTADLNNYRGVLGQTTRQAGLAGSRLENLFGIPGSGKLGGKGLGSPGSGEGGGNGSGNGGMGTNYKNSEVMTPMSHYAGPRLNQAMVKAQALPGRRFSKTADRKGWLYINTWYMIGPWENFGRDDFSIVHPPEVSVDFDAVYTDGQIGTGIVETDSHPIKMIGEKVELDGTLRWKFMQSESMHNTLPVTTGHSTYYAYTELYFEEATTMLVAIGTDDSGRVWINGKDVWRDTGTSWYHIDEHIAPFDFRQGWNRILVRLENGGGGAAGFSFLIIPQE